jgi:ketosteroid isomerase-like protein
MPQHDFRHVTAQLTQALSADSEESRRATLIRSVERQIEAIGRGDLEGAIANAAPDVLLEIFAPDEFNWVRRAQGVDQLRRAIAHNFGSVEDQRPELLNVITDGNTLVLFGRETGRVRATGHAYDMQFVHRFTFRGDQLASIRIIAAKTPPA